jgi:hypothetical protein
MSLQAAEIYKCVGPDGRPLYTSEKRDTAGKKCKVISREVNVVPMQAPRGNDGKTSRPGTYPREDAAARAEQESIRTGNERNYARVLQRLKPYQDDVETHEKNVEALKRELQNLRR